MPNIVALFSLVAATVASAQPATPARPPDWVASLSARALTLSVSLDTALAPAKSVESGPGWDITIMQESANRSSWLRLKFGEPLNDAPPNRAFHPESCQTLTDAYSCRDSATATIANGRLVIAIRDSAMLALLFSDRPMHVSLFSSIRAISFGRAVVGYGAPTFVPASKQALAEYDRALGREGWSPWTRALWAGIANGANGRDTLWMQVGDRTTAAVSERQGRGIDSINERSDFTVARWTSTDSSVIAFAPSNDPPHAITLVALRPGRSTIAATDMRGPSDELPRSHPVRTLTRHIVVTNRVARIEIAPRPGKIVAGTRFKPVARVIDVNGAVVHGLPIDFYVIYDIPDPYGWEGKKYDLAGAADLTAPGKRRFIARFAGFADTLDVRVVPRR